MNINKQEVKLLSAILGHWLTTEDEPYNAVQAILGIADERRDPTRGKNYNEDDDIVVLILNNLIEKLRS